MSKPDRREFMVSAGAFAASMAGVATSSERETRRRPNVVLILTDDQGYGDLSAHDNPYLETPNLDRLHREAVRFERFHVCPVCTPTRASLMTGRYNFRTRAIDTYLGRAMMDPGEMTVAELLRDAGYRTGIFGKWHLGDNYPMRAMDQGFEESLVHRGGGLMQPSDWPDNTYFDPVLSRNGEDWKSRGYCTDVFTAAALDFIKRHRDELFFCYLAANAPHVPLQVPESDAAPYRAMGLDEDTAKAYGMIANLDANVGRVLARLDELGIARDTLVIFMTDNGPQPFGNNPLRYNAGMRGAKGTVYEGGIRVPSLWRWPGTLESGKAVSTLAAHIDVLPTLLELCDASQAPGLELDGLSLYPLLMKESSEWPDRYIFTQWHRGDAPEPFRDCAVMSQHHKLVDGKELYDLIADPLEKEDIAAEHPEIVAQMRKAYEEWFADVSASRGYDPPRIHIGTPHENPVVLTRQDWRGAQGWDDSNRGHWLLYVANAGSYDVTLTFSPLTEAGEVGFRLGDVERSVSLNEGAASYRFEGVTLAPGNGKLDTWLPHDGKQAGAYQVAVEKV
jgi:arylsulfatase A-like enzyme